MFRTCLASALTLAALGSPAARATQPTLTVHVYDLAGAGSALDGAMERVTAIARKAGITLEWRRRAIPDVPWDPDHPFNPERTPTDLIVRLLPEEAARELAPRRSIHGFAHPVGPGHFRYMATLFFDRVKDAAQAYNSTVPAVLGNLIAHELGHLLLGLNAHSLTGLMRSPFGVEEFRAADRGHLQFTDGQARTIRSEVNRRMRAASERSLAAAAATTSSGISR